jgi:hypothetical protein
MKDMNSYHLPVSKNSPYPVEHFTQQYEEHAAVGGRKSADGLADVLKPP